MLHCIYLHVNGTLRVATNHPPQNSLTFPDFSLTLYSFPYPLTDQKIIFILYFNDANCITSNLGGTPILLKEFAPLGSKFFPIRTAHNEEGNGLRLPLEKVHPFTS